MKADMVSQSPGFCNGEGVEKTGPSLSDFTGLSDWNKCTIMYNTGREGQS